MSQAQWIDIFVSGAVTLAAAFAGAWYAFRLTDREKARQTTREQVASVNRAQFVLIQQINDLKMIQEKIIEPTRHHPVRSLAMRPFLSDPSPAVRLDPDSLSFLLETDDREFPFRLLIQQQRYHSALMAMSERSRLHLELVQPRLAAAGIREGIDYSRSYFVDALGEDLFLRMERATEDAIDLVEKTLRSGPELVAEFHSATKRRFPKHVIITLAPPAD